MASLDQMLSTMLTERLKSVKSELRKEYKSEIESLRNQVSSLTDHVETLDEQITQLQLKLNAVEQQNKAHAAGLDTGVAGGIRTAAVELRSFEVGSTKRTSPKSSTLFEKDKRRSKRGASATTDTSNSRYAGTGIHQSRTSNLHFDELTSDHLTDRMARAKSVETTNKQLKTKSKPLPLKPKPIKMSAKPVSMKHRRKESDTAKIFKEHIRKRSNSATPDQIGRQKKKFDAKTKSPSVSMSASSASRRGGVSKPRKKKPNWPLPSRPRPSGTPTGGSSSRRGFISSVSSSTNVVQTSIKVKVGNRYLLLDDRYGICRYWDGKTLGLELEIGIGDTDGTLKSGRKAFSCAANKGLFVKKDKIAMDCGKP